MNTLLMLKLKIIYSWFGIHRTLRNVKTGTRHTPRMSILTEIIVNSRNSLIIGELEIKPL